ncbi:MAG: carboxy terminal-processing peptidase, partial [Flammeovirgaceae bacterium]|nr:carboxy terminal-processing peptidase [Flammeovirgaceae bacterium]MDW8287173.1 carboxy terminal-processing peptidase [Flammeovirgaceae bacterium]
AKLSQERIKKNALFKLIEENALRLKNQREQTYQTLNFKEFDIQQLALKAESEKIKNLTKEYPDLLVKPLEEWKPVTQQDSAKLASDENWRKELKKDAYVYEATEILFDIMKNRN